MGESGGKKKYIVILSIVLFFSLLEWANAHRVHSKMLQEKAALEEMAVERELSIIQQGNGEKILLLLRMLANDPRFCELLVKKDQYNLRRYLTPVFINWQSQGIDNIGILDSEKKVVLRLATPELTGDNITNFLKTTGAFGEYEAKNVVGPLGYRFRVAIPVFYQNKLAGYLMAGMFWERLIREIKPNIADFGIVVFLEHSQFEGLGLRPDNIIGKFTKLENSFVLAQNRDYSLKFLNNLSKITRDFPQKGIYKVDEDSYYLVVKKGNSGERIVFLIPFVESISQFYRDAGRMGLLILLELSLIWVMLMYFNREIKEKEEKVTRFLKKLNQKEEPTNLAELPMLGECSIELNKYVTNSQKMIANLENELKLNALLKKENEEQAIYKLLLNFLEEKYQVKDAAILVLNESQNRLEVKAIRGSIGCNPEILEDKEGCVAISRGREVVRIKGSLDRCPEYQGKSSYACMPLIIGGEVKGLIHVDFPADEQENMSQIKRIAEIAAPYLYNARLLKALEYSSIIDELTKVYNRRFFVNFLEKEIAFCRRFGSSLGLILLDLDDFKLINDIYGHPMGDEVLQRVGEVLKKKVRAQDVVARYGGEEFCVVLPGTGWQGSYEVAQKLKEAINELKFSDPGLKITASIGVTVFPEEAKNLEQLLGIADKLLYYAKNAGKNRVIGLKDLNFPNS